MASNYRHILFAREGRIGFVTMNRPDKRNALSVEHMQELMACFRAIGDDRSLAVVILAGNGPGFSAGHDLQEMLGREPDFYRHEFAVCTELMQTIQSIAQPVIAQVHGIATAAGCQLVATCDLAVAEEGARFATPGVKVGIFCTTPMVALTRAVGQKKAMEMLLTADFVSAPEALAHGLINKVVPADQLAAQTLALAQKIATGSSAVIETGKQAFYRQYGLPQAQAYAYATTVMADSASHADAQEGMDAFVHKRKPQWQGR
ncbi:MAG: enoyl-CoA hydratase [Aquabacterium sp.]